MTDSETSKFRGIVCAGQSVLSATLSPRSKPVVIVTTAVARPVVFMDHLYLWQQKPCM